MLKIQEFILAHKNWRELLANAPYNLKISEEDGFVLFKYNQIESDFHEEICREARGLILDSQNNFRVVRYAFKKFFNVDEPFADKICWEKAAATEKIDGSIMTLWYARGKWHLSTNGTIDAYKAELQGVGPYKTFGELFDAAAQNISDVLWTGISTQYNYTFELVSPYNQVVIRYDQPKLYLLSVRDMTTLEEYFEPAHTPDIERPRTYHFNSEKDIRDLVAEMGEGHEGVVVRDIYGNRVKIKTLLYFQLHRMANNGNMTLERAVDLIRTNDTDEFLSYFPEYEEYFNKIRAILDQIEPLISTVERIASYSRELLEAQYSERVARKIFAQTYVDFDIKNVYFDAYNGNLRKKVEAMNTAQFLKYFHVLFKEVE